MLNPQTELKLLSRRLSRRQALQTSSAGFGSLALAGLLGQDTMRNRAWRMNRQTHSAR